MVVLPAERHRKILGALANDRIVGTNELVSMLGVSTETIRRDLIDLEDASLVDRVRGGAVLRRVGAAPEPHFATRSEMATEAKAALARCAAELVEPGMTVMIDVGTSCVQLAKALAGRFSGTVVTCSIPAAVELSGNPEVEVVLSGGRLRSGDLSLSNHLTTRFFADIRPDIAFLGSGGVDARAGLTDFHLDEVHTRQLVLDRTSRSYVLADSSKFGAVAPYRVCDLEDFTGLVTECPPGGPLATKLAEVGSEIHAPLAA